MPKPSQPLQPFELSAVTIEDQFWAPRCEVNRLVTLPQQFIQLRKTGRIDALRLKWKPGQPNKPHPFWDSDFAKWTEAACYSLTTHPDRALARKVEQVVELLAAAQREDGYLNTYFTLVEPENRWRNLRDRHELYCGGHLMEAAVAHHQATGSRKLLDVLARYADHIAARFGPRRGQRRGYPGHEEIELGLMKLYRATDDHRYLKLAKFFVDERGRPPHYFDKESRARNEEALRGIPGYEYYQAHKPVREQTDAVGHAVRAMYLYCGMADLAAETNDSELLAACRNLWTSATTRKMYITGGVGSHRRWEDFGENFELPSETAYAETCAAIGLVFFAHRMARIERDARYVDVLERALYNGAISGASLDGRRFLYVNPLSSGGSHHRQEWFRCACCPPNLARLLSSLGSYIYAADTRAAYVNLYIAGQGQAEIAGRPVTFVQRTNYPWDGQVGLTVRIDKPAAFALMLRIPGWCREWKVKINGKSYRPNMTKGYARLRRTWRDGDTVDLTLSMPVERIVAHPSVGDAAGRVALQRGPLVYCLEECDHAVDVRGIELSDRSRLTTRFDEKLLGGCVVIEGKAFAPSQSGWQNKLYRRAKESGLKTIRLRAIPYYLWDNRKPGTMTVFMPR